MKKLISLLAKICVFLCITAFSFLFCFLLFLISLMPYDLSGSALLILSLFSLILPVIFSTWLTRKIFASDKENAAEQEPVIAKPAPVIEKPEPAIDEPAPETKEPIPVSEDPKPVTEEPTPVIKEPVPVIDEPEPVIEAPKPAPAPRTAALEQPTPRATRRFTEKTKTYKVAGVTHYTENIMNLSSENSDYFLSKRELIEEDLTNERIWKYEFYPERVELVPEPDNPEDRNAIKVIVDDEHVGYIKRGSCTHVHTLLNTGNITGITCTIGGGPYKYISEEYDDERDRDVYTLEKDETTLFVRLEISEKVLIPVADDIKQETPPQKEQEGPRRTFYENDIDDGIKRTYCINCGKEVGDALHCPHCGMRTEKDPWKSVSATSMAGESDKDKWIAFLLCLFLGGIGAHRFYVGKIGSGILYLFTGGVFGIGTLIDFIMILCGAFTDEDGRILE